MVFHESRGATSRTSWILAQIATCTDQIPLLVGSTLLSPSKYPPKGPVDKSKPRHEVGLLQFRDAWPPAGGRAKGGKSFVRNLKRQKQLQVFVHVSMYHLPGFRFGVAPGPRSCKPQTDTLVPTRDSRGRPRPGKKALAALVRPYSGNT